MDFNWFICSYQLFSYEQKREINSRFERSSIKRNQNYLEVNKMAKNERFKIVYSQGTVDVTQILVDTETGVNYVFRKVAYAGGLTPLLDKDGKPVISPIVNS